MIVASTPLDDFLASSGSSTETAEQLQRIGLTLGVGGVALAVGAIVFLAVVPTGRRSDVPVIARLVVAGGALSALGGAIELAGVASLLDIGWNEALTDDLGTAAMMRLVGGAIVGLAFVEAARRRVAAEPPGAPPDDSRWAADAPAGIGFVGAAFAMLSFGFDGHTETEGPRVVHAVTNLVHVAAGSAWFGGLVALAVVSWRRRRHGHDPRILHAFSTVATVSLTAVAVAGVIMAGFILDGLSDLTGTPWGRQLLVKTALVGVTAAIGAYNHFVVIGRLDANPDDQALAQRARLSVTVEVVVLVAVVVVTGLLATSSTN